MSYTYNDFVMESAMVETTNDTLVSDIQMEQWNAEFNVACAAFDALNKYSLIAEYAQCDVEEFVQESLDDKINKVDDWKNSGGKMKKVLGTIASGALKAFRAVAKFFKNLFSKQNNPFRKLANYLKANSKKNYRDTIADLGMKNREIEKLKGELAEEKATRERLAQEGVKLSRQLKGVLKEAKRYKTLYQNLQQNSAKALEEANTIIKNKNADVDRLQGTVIEHINKFNEALALIKKNSEYKTLRSDLKTDDKAFIEKYGEKEDNGKTPTMEEVVEVLFSAADASEKTTENIDNLGSLMPDINDVVTKVSEKDAAKSKATFVNIQETGNALLATAKKSVADLKADMQADPDFKNIIVK